MSDYLTDQKLEDMQLQINGLKLALEEERRSNQHELNVLTRRIVQLHEKLLGEAPAKMRRVS